MGDKPRTLHAHDADHRGAGGYAVKDNVGTLLCAEHGYRYCLGNFVCCTTENICFLHASREAREMAEWLEAVKEAVKGLDNER